MDMKLSRKNNLETGKLFYMYNATTKLLFISVVILSSFLFFSCSFFEEPSGTSELLSVYKQDDKDIHYLHATLKITNISNKKIYSSTISVQADTNLRTYYKTISLDITITPDNCVYIPIELDFTQKSDESPTETWDENSFVILSETYK